MFCLAANAALSHIVSTKNVNQTGTRKVGCVRQVSFKQHIMPSPRRCHVTSATAMTKARYRLVRAQERVVSNKTQTFVVSSKPEKKSLKRRNCLSVARPVADKRAAIHTIDLAGAWKRTGQLLVQEHSRAPAGLAAASADKASEQTQTRASYRKAPRKASRSRRRPDLRPNDGDYLPGMRGSTGHQAFGTPRIIATAGPSRSREGARCTIVGGSR